VALPAKPVFNKQHVVDEILKDIREIEEIKKLRSRE
jgi:hypothetical protein